MKQLYDNISDAKSNAIKLSSAHQSIIYAIAEINKKYCVISEPLIIGHGLIEISKDYKIEYKVVTYYLNGNIYKYIDKIYNNCKKEYHRENFNWTDESVIEFFVYLANYDSTILRNPRKVKKLMNIYKDYKNILKSMNL